MKTALNIERNTVKHAVPVSKANNSWKVTNKLAVTTEKYHWIFYPSPCPPPPPKKITCLVYRISICVIILLQINLTYLHYDHMVKISKVTVQWSI
jgi:hypothetical protein